MTTKVDEFFNKTEKWHDELVKLRTIILDCGLTEELKWNVPIYTFQNRNIVGINGLKDCCAISFFKGVLLNDAENILTRPGQHTQAARWAKFNSTAGILVKEAILKAYIYEAIELEKSGLKVIPKTTEENPVPDELRQKFNELPAFKAAFEALTPGRQRGYLLYFAAPKQTKTREARIEKYIPQILAGKGLMD